MRRTDSPSVEHARDERIGGNATGCDEPTPKRLTTAGLGASDYGPGSSGLAPLRLAHSRLYPDGPLRLAGFTVITAIDAVTPASC